MKPFLGINLTTNSKNEQTIGNEFLIYRHAFVFPRKNTPAGFPQQVKNLLVL